MSFKIPKIKKPSEAELIESYGREFRETYRGVKFSDWSEKLRSVSYPFEIYTMSNDQVEGLLDIVDNGGKGIDEATWEMERLIPFLPDRFFMKLITRSPKDFLYDEFNHGKPKALTTHKEIVHSLCSSMRTFEDLCMLKYVPNHAQIVIRPYVDLDPLDEWRVYIKDKEIVGISQYYYDEVIKDTYLIGDIDTDIRKFIREVVIPEITVDSFIADVVYNPVACFLLETNPWGSSDPCLFKSYDRLNGRIAFRRDADSVTFHSEIKFQ